MAVSVKLSPGLEPYVHFDCLQMRSYSTEEVEKLSVMQISQIEPYDNVGHPIRGGLCDPQLGPVELYDICETCHQQGVYCPGHMGHIKLDVPVFNPLFYRFTYALMKGTCVQCHRLTCRSNGVATKVLLAQLRALNMGLISVAQELKVFIQDKFKNSLNSNVNEVNGFALNDELHALAELDKAFEELCGSENATEDFTCPTKNTLELKTNLIRTFCKDHLFKHVQRCQLCKQRNGIVRNDNDRCILLDFSGSVASKVRKLNGISKPKLPLEAPEDGIEEEEGDELVAKEDMKKSVTAEDCHLDTLNESPEFILRKQLHSVENGFCTKLAWRAVEVREHFRLLWKNDGFLLKKLFSLFDHEDGSCPLDVLFCDTVLVPPNKFRPIRLFKGSEFQHPQTVNLKRLLEATETFRAIRMAISGTNDTALLELIATRVPGKTMAAKLHSAYLALQRRMNALFDQDLDRSLDQKSIIPGLRQILEKKQGLFRMNMMGKRVNYACRSVITPDPYLDVDEIGIPEVFAKKLTFNEPANAFNIAKLRRAIRNGPTVHPGANFVQKNTGQKQILLDSKPNDRFSLAKRLHSADTSSLLPPAQVLRHLGKGDMMLMNRQPSLHKLSIMGHRTRVIKGQRAMRLNYAPCKAYNADFDGDEMNGHFVQDRVAQAEVAEIGFIDIFVLYFSSGALTTKTILRTFNTVLANVGSNFLVPKDGTPLLGLIQDHVISGVKLTLRGRFFNKEDFMHLLFAAFAETDQRFHLPPPAIIKPEMMWSGKQIISTILLNCIPKGRQLINLTSKAKTPLSCWKAPGKSAPSFNMSESEVVFRQAELLVGVLDKQHYGSTQYGLLHCCWELYGHRCATRIMSCFSRLFTTYLQFHGFTLGVADILVRKAENKKRVEIIEKLRVCGDEVVKECFELPSDASQEDIKNAMATAYCNPRHDPQHVQRLDFKMKERLNKFTEQIMNICVPSGLVRQFPDNALQAMILCGAKGTMVNSMQISCGLGQIELEGQRPPITAAGRTLPSFRAFDTSPRAGGFVDQRFLTGMNPQELFFHTMAGREGLIDTAVKTSRSGYLQRCIVKHLEGLVVHYDSTVRDHDNSVIQFRYGEDGMDVCKCTFMNSQQFEFLSKNMDAVRSSVVPPAVLESDWNYKKSEKAYGKIKKWRNKYRPSGKKTYNSGFVEFSKKHAGSAKESIVKKWFDLSEDERAFYMNIAGKRCPRMVDEKLNPTSTLGALPEKMLDDLDEFIKKKQQKSFNFPSETFKKTLYWKGLRSRADPGENVGLLAAQSIGEPSTQMTLNTFHFAGRGEMNVTLGIPRLREILMTASNEIKTPSAEIRVKPGVSQERIDKIKQELDRIYLKQVIRKTTVEERVNLGEHGSCRSYELGIEILPSKFRDPHVRHLKRLQILLEIEHRFIKAIAKVIQDRSREMQTYQAIQHKKLKLGNLAAGIGGVEENYESTYGKQHLQDEQSSDEEADAGKDADAGEVRLNKRHLDDAADYEGEDDEKNDISLEQRFENENGDVLVDSEAEETELNSSEMEDVTNRSFGLSKPSTADETRREAVIKSSTIISNYKFDSKKNRWCVITFQLPLSTKTRLDVASLVEKELETFIIWETPGVEKCIQREENHNGEICQILATQGVNIQAFFKHFDALDVNSLYSNDLNLILKNYGIEACSRALVKIMQQLISEFKRFEKNNFTDLKKLKVFCKTPSELLGEIEIVRVFTPYGIEVNKRHLTLTADYMTFTGQIQPFSRGAMGNGASPLQKMTFETTISFMRDAVVNGDVDYLASPSARIIVGRLMRGGTGAFELLVPNTYYLGRRIKEELDYF